jgi:hypothetical protein
MKIQKITTATLALLALSVFSFTAHAKDPAQQSWTFKYRTPQSEFKITKNAASHEQAFKLAAKDCFQKLTNGKYPGEEKGLEIIDVCANPKN